MENQTETPPLFRRRTPADDTRHRVLVLSAALLLLTMAIPLLDALTTGGGLITGPPYFFSALLVPATATSCALSYFDDIRCCPRLVVPDFLLDIACRVFWAHTCFTFSLIAISELSPGAFLLASCLLVTWSWLLESGLGFDTRLGLPFYYAKAALIVGVLSPMLIQISEEVRMVFSAP